MGPHSDMIVGGSLLLHKGQNYLQTVQRFKEAVVGLFMEHNYPVSSFGSEGITNPQLVPNIFPSQQHSMFQF